MVHCEINSELSEIVAHNYQQLGITNVECFSGNGMNVFKTRCIKNSIVFISTLPEETMSKERFFYYKTVCHMYRQKLISCLKKLAQILIKTSPILDISNTINDLKNVEKVRVFALNNEVKELLFVLKKGYEGKILIEAVNDQKGAIQKMEFDSSIRYKVQLCPTSTLIRLRAQCCHLKIWRLPRSGAAISASKIASTFAFVHLRQLWLTFPGRAFSVDALHSV